MKKNEGNGKLVFFDRASFKRVYEIEVTNAVSSSLVPKTTNALITGISFSGLICWLQTKMTQNDAQWKRNRIHNET